MAERLQLPVPMCVAQFRLLGGYRRLVAMLVIVATLILAGSLGFRRLLPREPLSNVAGWLLYMLAFLQLLVLVLGGCNAVYRAMLRDYETKMIESHRLTPMTSFGVVLGYIFGSTLQMTTLFALFTLSGVVISYVAPPTAIEPWVYGNLLLLNGAIMLWAATVFFELRPEKPFSPAPVLIGIAGFTFLVAAVPGAALLFNVYTVLLGFWLITGGVAVAAPAVVIAGAVNVVFTLFWISSAAVKYRRPDLPAFNGGRGLTLLMLVAIVGTAGLVAFEEITTTRMPEFHDSGIRESQWIATMIGLLLLGLVAVAGAVKCQVLGASGTALRGWSDRRPSLLVAVLACVIIAGIMAAMGIPFWRKLGPDTLTEEQRADFLALAWPTSVLACLFAILTMRSVFELGYRTMKSPRFLVALMILFAWGLPPLADAMRAQFVSEFSSSVHLSWFFGSSPCGTIIGAWSYPDLSLWPGLLAQFGVLLLIEATAWRSRRRSHGLSNSPTRTADVR